MSTQVLFKDGVKGWHVFAIMCSFFGSISAVLAFFAYLAVKTYPGEERDAYVRGLRYNQSLLQSARMAERGWSVSAVYREGKLQVALVDSLGSPVSGETVDAEIRRPVTSRFDRTIRLGLFHPCCARSGLLGCGGSGALEI